VTLSVAKKAELYARYPTSTPWIYNGVTTLHFALGGAGILIGYGFAGWLGILFGVLYLVFALGEMYLLMPLKVCPHCVYYPLENARCVSAVNLLSRRIARPGRTSAFGKRAEGTFSPNNLYMVALLLPIVAAIPALILGFSLLLLGILLGLIALLAFRFFVIFPRLGCVHCRAKSVCPQAASMGVRER
jgi:hypothetical protein